MKYNFFGNFCCISGQVGDVNYESCGGENIKFLVDSCVKLVGCRWRCFGVFQDDLI